MRKLCFVAAAIALAASSAFAQMAAPMQWQVGQRVLVGLNGQQGTIIEIQVPQMMNGGALVKVHLDSMPPNFPNIGISYDTVVAQVTPLSAPMGAMPAQQAMPMQAQPMPMQAQPMPMQQAPVQGQAVAPAQVVTP